MSKQDRLIRGRGSCVLLAIASLLIQGCGSGAETVVLGDPPPPPVLEYQASGPVGGPFTAGDPVSVVNATDEPFEYTVSADQPWLIWSAPSSGTLPAGGQLAVGLSIDPGTAPASLGGHTATLIVEDLTTQTYTTTINVALDVYGAYSASGAVGGPFTGVGNSYQLVNTSSSSLDYQLSSNQSWMAWDVPTSGSIPASGSLDMNLSIDTASSPGQSGSYGAVVTITDASTQSAISTITVALTVTDPVSGAPMTAANRTSGAAPLGVFFDVADKASPAWQSGVVQPANGKFGSFLYEWNFGDSAAGTWSTSGKSRNTDTGFTAAHVFESPGEYTVSLKVTDPATSNVYDYVQTITVTGLTGNTYYVDATGGNDSNDGLSQGTAWRTIGKALSSGDETNATILFKRGETFSSNSKMVINAAGPGLIGAYGTGAKPIISASNTTGVIEIQAHDWRVTDLDFRGPGASDNAKAVGLHYNIRVDNTLMWKLDINGFRTGVEWSNTFHESNPPSGSVLGEIVTRNTGVHGMFVGGQKIAVMGCDMRGPMAQHVIRMFQGYNAVINHNILKDSGTAQHALKLHGVTNSSGNLETQYVTINDNVFRGGGAWAIAIGPQNAQRDERIRQVLFERNRTEGSTRVQMDLLIWARDVTIRNNIFSGTGSSIYYTAILISTRGVEPSSQNVDVMNNTVYKGDSGQECDMVRLGGCSNVNVRNNLGSAPSTSAPLIVRGTCTNLVSTPNSLTNTPGFTNAGAGDFSLTAGSSAVDAGVALNEVVMDFAGNPRTSGASPDLGAFER